jgi:hypothetical protein
MVTALGRSRWRGGRFACYAPHVMPQGRAFNCDFRFSLVLTTQAKSIAEQRLIELTVDNPSEHISALETLGATYLKLGQTEKANEAFAKVHKVNSELSIKTCELKTDSKDELSVVCSFLR